MLRCILIIIVALALLVPLESRTGWENVVTQVEKSLVRIESEALGVCSGFTINRKTNHVLTAAHCVMTEFTVEGLPSTPILVNTQYDLAVVTNAGPSRPPMKFRMRPVKAGIHVLAIGYAFGLTTPSVRFGMVSLAAQDFGSNFGAEEGGDMGGVWTVTDFPFLKGQSGGPVVDEEGKVVMVCQQANEWTGIGRPLTDILRVASHYWEF